MAYDKKLLAAARRELERERTAHTEELEARRRDIYTREPRIRAIDRELSTTAASVLRAAMESGGDPTAAIESCATAISVCRRNAATCSGSWDFPPII